MKVKELIKHLLKGEQEADVVVLDHFGREIVLDEYNFNFMNLKRGENPQGLLGWKLVVECPDIGPEPE